MQAVVLTNISLPAWKCVAVHPTVDSPTAELTDHSRGKEVMFI
jgi:hypothetical protein